MLTRRTLMATALVAPLAAPSITRAQTMTKMKAGMVAGFDQVGLPIALERGFFEKNGLDVEIARPYATGVDALNALQAGETQLVQVGVPMIGAVTRGMDLVALANYSGNATKRGSDATMAMIARADAGIDKGNLASLRGKKIAASFGTINHLYALALIEKAGLTTADVTLVNTPPPDMTVALLAKGIDAFTCWDPVPLNALRDVAGAFEVIRGGDVIAYVGFNVGMRPWVEGNGATIEKFLAAVSEADQWMRKNPKNAAQVATRWIPGLRPEIAEQAMEFNIQQADRRLSQNNYRAMWAALDRLNRLGFLKTTFDVNRHIEPKHILKVMADKPQLFADLPAIPDNARITPGYVFRPEAS
jgi:ABC-type nitrate/sulfonate/bicarbonate transport system substrate-binding protein